MLKNPNEQASTPTAFTRLARIVKLALILTVVIASLITFPSGISYLALAWLAASVICLITRRAQLAGICSLLLVIILAAKTPSASVAMVAMIIAILCAALACLFSKVDWIQWSALLTSLAVAVWFSFDRSWESTMSNSLTLTDDWPIVCIGDSLTEGIKGGFPSELQKLVSNPVINLGRNGYTAQMAIDDVLPQLNQIRPQLVVVELGGHDYNTGESRADTKRKLQYIIREIQGLGVTVVIVEIPRGIIQDPFYGLERELTREFDLELVPDTIVRRCFFFSPIMPPGIWIDKKYHLSDDGLHPNAIGQVEFAKAVAAAIDRISE